MSVFSRFSIKNDTIVYVVNYFQFNYFFINCFVVNIYIIYLNFSTKKISFFFFIRYNKSFFNLFYYLFASFCIIVDHQCPYRKRSLFFLVNCFLEVFQLKLMHPLLMRKHSLDALAMLHLTES